ELGHVHLALPDLVLPVHGEPLRLEGLGPQLGDDLVGVVRLGADGDAAGAGVAAAVGPSLALAVLLGEGIGAAAGRGAEREGAGAEGAEQVATGVVDRHG